MTARLVGMIDLQRVLAELPEKLERNVLRGAMKEGAEVIANGARENCRSSEVRESIGTAIKTTSRTVTALVQTKGDGAYLAPWLEYGTAAHIIKAKDALGRTAGRLNRLNKKGALMIGGAFVGELVWHPGAKPYPFMRPAADQREGDAVAAIGAGIAKRIGRINDQAAAESEA